MTDPAFDMSKWHGSKLPEEFGLAEDDIQGMLVGDTIRLCHRFKRDNSVCSMHKDNAMTVHRYVGGWWWKCFRCNESGFVHADYTSPEENVKRLMQAPVKHNPVDAEVSLPYDCFNMHEAQMQYNDLAWQWLWKYDMTDELMEQYQVAWSPSYKRIIFPVWDMYLGNQGAVGKDLIGWVGRCPYNLPKDQRQKEKRPKWLTKRSLDVETLRYYVYRNASEWTVLVEDVVSAIKVAHSANVNTIALLNKHISKNLMKKLQGLSCIVWLDDDAKGDALDFVARMNTLGIKTRMISTLKDPKALPSDHIEKLIDRRRVGY